MLSGIGEVKGARAGMADMDRFPFRVVGIFDRGMVGRAVVAFHDSKLPGGFMRFIIHDAMAKEVDRETFFHTRESGGTMISSAYKLCAEIIQAEYPPNDWNIYLVPKLIMANGERPEL